MWCVCGVCVCGVYVVCVCVSVCMCVHACVCVCMHVCVHACVCVRVCTCCVYRWVTVQYGRLLNEPCVVLNVRHDIMKFTTGAGILMGKPTNFSLKLMQFTSNLQV